MRTPRAASAGSIALALVLASVALPAAAADRPTAARGASAIMWGPCADAALTEGGVECGTVPVPLDHAKPRGRQIVVDVSRLRATGDPAEYLGPLLLNPGGPGAPGLDFGLALAGSLPPEVLAGYDLIGFDPRGIGESSPTLVCDPDLLRGTPAPDYVPASPTRIRADERRLLNQSIAYAKACGERNGTLLEHLRTIDVAYDLDAIRAALGAAKLNYVGFSYGTYIGQVYASTFPTRVGRMVLSGNVAPDGVGYTGDLGRPAAARAFDANIRRFFGWVARYDAIYHLGADIAAVQKHYFDDQDALRRAAVAGIGPSEWTTIFFSAAYFEQAWPVLAQGWASWDAGRPKTFADALAFSAKKMDAGSAAAFSVVCSDGPWDRTYRQLRAERFRTAAAAPFSAWALFWGESALCIHWPVPGRATRVGSASAAPILLVNGTYDAPTQFSEALASRRAFGRSVLVEEIGGVDHAGGSFAGNACIDAVVTPYLLTGALPVRVAGNRADVGCPRGQEPGYPEILQAALAESALANLPPGTLDAVPEIPASAPPATLATMLAELIAAAHIGTPVSGSMR